MLFLPCFLLFLSSLTSCCLELCLLPPLDTCIEGGPLGDILILCLVGQSLEHTTLDLCVRVLITLYLQARLWWLYHWRYKSVVVGFLQTQVVRVPSYFGVTNVSRNGMEPSSLGSSVVNLMEGSKDMICCCSMTKVSSTYLFHNLGGSQLMLRLCVQSTPCINLLLQDPQDIP